MRLFPLVLCVVMMTTVASAQQIQAHLAFSQGTHTKLIPGLVMKDSLQSRYLSAPEGRNSYGAGVAIRFGYEALKPVFCQAEATARYQKASYILVDSVAQRLAPSTYTPATHTSERFAIDLPVQVGLKISWVRLQGGIVPTFTLPEAGTKNFDAYWTELFNFSNLAYTYGVGLDIVDLVSLDVRFQNDFGQRREMTVIPSLDNKRGSSYFNDGQFLVKLGVRISKEK